MPTLEQQAGSAGGGNEGSPKKTPLQLFAERVKGAGRKSVTVRWESRFTQDPDFVRTNSGERTPGKLSHYIIFGSGDDVHEHLSSTDFVTDHDTGRRQFVPGEMSMGELRAVSSTIAQTEQLKKLLGKDVVVQNPFDTMSKRESDKIWDQFDNMNLPYSEKVTSKLGQQLDGYGRVGNKRS